MHKFTTSSGKCLWYDVTNNRISLYSKDKEQETCPVVCFNQPATVDGSRITMFTIEMTQQCNLRCSYCCYSGSYRDRRAHNETEISYELLGDVVEFIKSHADKNAPEITVCFYGGEALLARKKIEWIAGQLYSIYGQRIRFSLSTNGLALTESVIDWLASFEHFLVNVTIDGNKMMHDKCRKTITGKGSYDTIIKNLELFKRKYPSIFDQRVRFLSTVYSWNDVKQLAKVWDDEPVLKGHYPVHISHILPDFLDSARSYDSWEVKDSFYREAFIAYVNGDKGIMGGSFQKLVNIIDRRSLHKLPNEQNIKTCFQELYSCFINVDGDLYACEKFCGTAKIGNVKCGFDEQLALPLLKAFSDRKNKLCPFCWAQRFCRMCMTSLNYTDEEIKKMCNMERDTIDLALKYYCDLKDWEQTNHKKIQR